MITCRVGPSIHSNEAGTIRWGESSRVEESESAVSFLGWKSRIDLATRFRSSSLKLCANQLDRTDRHHWEEKTKLHFDSTRLGRFLISLLFSLISVYLGMQKSRQQSYLSLYVMKQCVCVLALLEQLTFYSILCGSCDPPARLLARMPEFYTSRRLIIPKQNWRGTFSFVPLLLYFFFTLITHQVKFHISTRICNSGHDPIRRQIRLNSIYTVLPLVSCNYAFESWLTRMFP